MSDVDCSVFSIYVFVTRVMGGGSKGGGDVGGVGSVKSGMGYEPLSNEGGFVLGNARTTYAKVREFFSPYRVLIWQSYTVAASLL